MEAELLAAVVQLTSTKDIDANLSRAAFWVGKAASSGAQLIVLPENFAFLGQERDKRVWAQCPATGPFVAPMRDLAKKLGVFLLLGSIPERGPDASRTFNTSVLVGPQGEIVATYRKIHLFDVSLADGTQILESESVAAGQAVQTASVLGFVLGLSICYDLRFPELFREASLLGAHLLAVPAAFTLHTGKDHWQPLLRARAIENQCYVLAAAQFGAHSTARRSWGKSMIIDPWGAILAGVPEQEGMALARLSMADLVRIRSELPCLQHRRLGRPFG